MSVLIKGMEMPKSCYECKLDLRTDICKAFCEWNAEYPYSIRATDRLPDCPLSEVPELCDDTVLRASVEYICRKNTVSTNPYEHKYHEKFIKFMDDPEISDFGRWQHSNGFNTALVAVECDLDKVPSVTPERKTGKWNFIGDNMFECTSCGVVYTTRQLNGLRNCDADPYATKFCPNCGADMREKHERLN